MIQLKPGDIIGMQSADLVGRVINLGTWGGRRGLSHVGIIAHADGCDRQLLLYESTTLADIDCYYQGKPVSGVQAHIPEERFSSYNGKIWVYRLVPELRHREAQQLTRFLRFHIGTSYDYYGAFKARGSNWLARKVMPQSGLDSIFCSELVAAALQCLERVDLSYGKGWNPNRLKRYLLTNNVIRLVSRIHPPVAKPLGCL